MNFIVEYFSILLLNFLEFLDENDKFFSTDCFVFFLDHKPGFKDVITRVPVVVLARESFECVFGSFVRGKWASG